MYSVQSLGLLSQEINFCVKFIFDVGYKVMNYVHNCINKFSKELKANKLVVISDNVICMGSASIKTIRKSIRRRTETIGAIGIQRCELTDIADLWTYGQ